MRANFEVRSLNVNKTFEFGCGSNDVHGNEFGCGSSDVHGTEFGCGSSDVHGNLEQHFYANNGCYIEKNATVNVKFAPRLCFSYKNDCMTYKMR